MFKLSKMKNEILHQILVSCWQNGKIFFLIEGTCFSRAYNAIDLYENLPHLEQRT